jgi:hypothetical protein
MRAAPLLVLLWLMPPVEAAMAAPTCQDRHGITVRCGTGAAMPVGWTAPVYERTVPPSGNKRDMVIAAGAIILLLAMIALMPEFDGFGETGEAGQIDPADQFERRTPRARARGREGKDWEGGSGEK